MTPAELLSAARAMVSRPRPATAGLWSRAAALLGRQALEAALTNACHHHPYELPPTAEELDRWLDAVQVVVNR